MLYSYQLHVFKLRQATSDSTEAYLPAVLFQQTGKPPIFTDITIFANRGDLLRWLKESRLVDDAAIAEADDRLNSGKYHKIDLEITPVQAAAAVPKLYPEAGQVSPSPKYQAKLDRMKAS